jgi:thioesterase domain-containing protein
MLEIIQAVAKDHPIYCAPPSWYLLRNPKRYIADTAAFLAREILSIKPDGPYLIGGYCFHGWISFEIARILRASKRNVDLLFFLDDRAPHRWLRSSLAYIRKLLFQPKRKGQEAIERPIAETDNHLFENHPSIIELRTAAANYYKNGRPIYRGHTDIILHNSESQIKNFLDMLDWKGLIRGRLHVKFIKGYHDWKNPKQVLEFKRVIIKSLGESQKIADRRKNTH